MSGSKRSFEEGASEGDVNNSFGAVENRQLTVVTSPQILPQFADRVLRTHYCHDNGSATVNSPACDTFNDASSIATVPTANLIEAETRCQMIENINHESFFRKNPEKCHIKDHCKCTQTEDVDPNNFLYMSRFMHEHVDGINMIVTKTPSFAVVYKSHDNTAIDCPLIGADAVRACPLVKRYEVIVEIQFLTLTVLLF